MSPHTTLKSGKTHLSRSVHGHIVASSELYMGFLGRSLPQFIPLFLRRRLQPYLFSELTESAEKKEEKEEERKLS